MKPSFATDGFVTNCLLRTRNSETIFVRREDGTVVAYLNRYAIIPIEEYEALTRPTDEVMTMKLGVEK